MPSAGIAAIAILLSLAILFMRVRFGFAVLVASVVLVPGSLPVHNPLTNYAYFTRVLLVMLAIRLLLAVRAGEISLWAWRWTPVHSAFVVFVVSVFVAGVVLAQPVTPATRMLDGTLNVVDQFVFFAVALACVRVIGDLRWVLGVIAAVLLVSAGIGIIEHFTEASWDRFLFDGHTLTGTPAANPLEVRLDAVRVRAGAEYALQYGWVIAMLFPALLIWLATVRRSLRKWLPLALAAIAVVLAAEYWSYSRTALASIGAIALVVAVASRDRRLIVLVASGVAVCTVLFLALSGLQTGFLHVPSGYVTVRTHRLPLVLQVALVSPMHGVGVGALAVFGLTNTDSSYLQVYGETGLIGLVACIALLGSAAACCIGGLRSRVATDRYAAAAALAASLAMVFGGIAYDALRSLSSSRPFWLLVAVGVVATERTTGPLPALVRRPRPLLLGAVGGAVVAAAIAWAVVPVHYAQQYEFTTVPVFRETFVSDPVTEGHILANTVCNLASGVHATHPDSRVECRDLEQAAGVGVLRIQAGSPARVTALAHEVSALAGGVGLDAFHLVATTPLRSGRPTAAGYGLFWAPLGVLLALLLVPLGRQHAEAAGQVPPGMGTI